LYFYSNGTPNYIVRAIKGSARKHHLKCGKNINRRRKTVQKTSNQQQLHTTFTVPSSIRSCSNPTSSIMGAPLCQPFLAVWLLRCMRAPPSLGDQPGLFSPLSFWWPLLSALGHGLSPVPPAQPHIINSIITIKRISFYVLSEEPKDKKQTYLLFCSCLGLLHGTRSGGRYVGCRFLCILRCLHFRSFFLFCV